MTRVWPSFATIDLGPEDDEEMLRRWQVYDREMQVIIAAGGVHQDEDGWWVDDATGELIGPDPAIERPLMEGDPEPQWLTLEEALPELAESIRSLGHSLPKQAVTLTLDTEVVEAFKADGPGWQSRVNAALREVKKLPKRA